MKNCAQIRKQRSIENRKKELKKPNEVKYAENINQIS